MGAAKGAAARAIVTAAGTCASPSLAVPPPSLSAQAIAQRVDFWWCLPGQRKKDQARVKANCRAAETEDERRAVIYFRGDGGGGGGGGGGRRGQEGGSFPPIGLTADVIRRHQCWESKQKKGRGQRGGAISSRII